MFKWVEENIVNPLQDSVGRAAEAVGRGIVKVAKEVGRITEKVGVVGVMALAPIMTGVASTLGGAVVKGLEIAKNVSAPVVKMVKGLLDFSLRTASDGMNRIQSIGSAVLNTARNFTQTLGKKLGLTDKGADTFFTGADSAWSRSTGATESFEALVEKVGGENKFINAVNETVLDADVNIMPKADTPTEKTIVESKVIAKKLNANQQSLGSIDLYQPTTEDILGYDLGIETPMPATIEVPTVDAGSFTQDDVFIDMPEFDGFRVATQDEATPSLLERSGRYFKQMGQDAKEATLDVVSEAPKTYIDYRARAEVRDKVEEDMYGTPEERFEEELVQTRQLADAAYRAQSAPMLDFGTQTGGATTLASPTAYTVQSAPASTGPWGYSAYQSNVYGNRMAQFAN